MAPRPTLDLTLIPEALAVVRLPAGAALGDALAAVTAAGHRIARPGGHEPLAVAPDVEVR